MEWRRAGYCKLIAAAMYWVLDRLHISHSHVIVHGSHHCLPIYQMRELRYRQLK